MLSGRLYLFSAALLWSSSGVFTRLLTSPGPIIAAYRVLFAGLLVMFFVRPPFHFGKKHAALVVVFALLNLTFVTSMTVTSAANAIYLQYTGPLWMSLFCVFFWKEKLDRGSFLALIVGMVGILILILGAGVGDQKGVTLGLISGVGFAAVTIILRSLRESNASWLTTLEMLGAAVILFPVAFSMYPAEQWIPSTRDLLILVAFGIFQLGIPYILFARGLKEVSPQEAGVILLLEPLLNPIWTFLFIGEIPAVTTMIGGTFLIGALCLRYAVQFAAVKLTPTKRS